MFYIAKSRGFVASGYVSWVSSCLEFKLTHTLNFKTTAIACQRAAYSVNTSEKRINMFPSNLSQLISEKYSSALKGGNLHFTDTTTKKTKDAKSGMPYVLSYAPSLLKKPERGDQPERNPFEDPEPELTVLGEVADGDYRLVLNKFPIVAEHSLLVTKEFQDQKSPLSPKELYMSYQLLDTLDDEDEGKRHMVFYNSGPSSGSSQDHKHLQVLPLPNNFNCLQDKLCNGKEHFIPNVKVEPLQSDKVSFAHFVAPLPESPEDVNEDLLAMVYISLLQRTLSFFQDWTNEIPGLQERKGYNVLLTKQWMCLVPRSNTKAQSLDIGFNSTGYAGLVLIKQEDTFKKVQEDNSVIQQALLECGFPSTAGKKATEYEY
ncbi:ZYRO0F18216p [Zygosaccharomyces rouxii]|uniref:ZYRO0F18216p n=2 Tax=Zygosaccharomyces rouxii TaxID=4956 RepID=C5DZ50_ZYGRC|nr:uncharacterized protein ZYRO0F18216g [Zygosaccharomyces rouxii]KAH9201228.1 protein APA1 and 5',5'''-P-1,P-4-tetraphosphate phosphorylase 2 [Zygosaccharomyces rouxii]CAQ43313.1 Protein APA1 and 5',5'''-P-1,P-4-tetraphosphate phosphorylase 2 [Zygosaccharomyces rouxii]CAR29061.1 ZYRO0F18216p [Zygosaccharomyces rouxii]